MRSFLETWRRAKTANIRLPETDDPDYVSLEALLQHLFWAARGYMIWICEKLELSEPGIAPVPELDQLESNAEVYIEHLLERWRMPLADVAEERFFTPVHTSQWGVDYCIEAMLEHAVMHPVRHEFQLNNLIQEQT